MKKRLRAMKTGGEVHTGPSGINQGLETHHGGAKVQREGGIHYGDPEVAKAVAHPPKKRGFFGRMQQKFEHAFDRFRQGYSNLLDRALNHHWIFAIILSLVLSWQHGADSVPRSGLFPHG